MRLGQDSGDLAGESGKRRTRRRSGGSGARKGGEPDQAGPGQAPVAPAPPQAQGPAVVSAPPQAQGPAGGAEPARAQELSGPSGAPPAPDGRRGHEPPPAGNSAPASPAVSADAPKGLPSGGPPSGGPPAGGPPSGTAGAPGARPRFAKPLTTGALIGWTALSAILPGAAHLRAGKRRLGFILLAAFGVPLLGGAITAAVAYLSGNTGVFARDNMLATGVALAVAGAIAWFLLLLSSYVTLKPNRLSGRGQIVSGIVVGVLCVSVMAPFALTAGTVLTAKQTALAIFKPSSADPTAVPVKHEDPWAGRKRVNFLLVGGDGAGNREGVRTDSMNVASVHVATGNTVMFSLPRNLQHVHFSPGSALGKRFPDGFMRELPNGGLLNEVWQYAEDHPEVMPGKKAGERGPAALMDAIGHTLNLKVDYYALVNMFGFARMVDAIGGLKIRVERDIPWGGLYGTAGTIKAGYRTLSGEEALWYGRSRVGSDDFSRMARQRCVIGAFAQQATPSVVLTNFAKIAGVAKRMAKTDIPRELVEHLTDLALKVKDARITSLQFVPPEFYTGSPDWQKIRTATARALRRSEQPARRPQAAGVSASPGASGASPAPTPSPSRSAATRPGRTPTPNGKPTGESLSELCGF